MKFIDLRKHLSGEELAPCYYIAEGDEFLISSAADAFLAAAGSTDFDKSFLTNPTAQRLTEDCGQLSFSGGRRVVTVRDFAPKGTKETERVLKYLDAPNPLCLLVLIKPAADFVKKLGARAVAVDCSALPRETIHSWILRKLKATDTKMGLDERDFLIDLCGGIMSRISVETDKLISLSLGGEITRDNIAMLVTAETRYKSYELSEAIAQGSGDKAMEILSALLYEKNEPTVILAQILSYFRRLLYVCVSKGSRSDIAQLLGVKEYAVKMSAATAERWGARRLKSACELFYAADFAIKSGKMAARDALYKCVLDLLRI